jgi:hypothetical protein
VKLPNAERAVIDAAKVRDYLLSESHPVGRFKSAFFRSLGYSVARWEELEEDIRTHALAGDAETDEANAYGQKYRVAGPLAGRIGGQANIVTVWIVLEGEEAPRFITAFPGERE